MTESTPQHRQKTKGKPDANDIRAGQRLRVRRRQLGVSQVKLAEQVGLTFQQVQKYERGVNRMSAGRLVQFGRALEVPPAYFLDDAPEGETSLVDERHASVLYAKRRGAALAHKLVRLHEQDPSSITVVHGLLDTLLKGTRN